VAEKKTFSISRVVNAPRELVYKVYTEVDHLKHWLTPKGGKVVKAEMNFKVGGTYHYCQEFAGQAMWGLQVFQEIVPPAKIVLLQSFSNPEGGIGQHPMAPTWPKRMLATTLLEAVGEKQTKITITWQPYEASDVEIETFNNAFDGMNGGFNGTFELLEAYLAEIQK